MLLTCLIGVYSANAVEITVGVKGGVNSISFSQPKEEPKEFYEGENGGPISRGLIGLSLAAKMSDRVALRLEVMHSVKGGERELTRVTSGGVVTENAIIELEYVEIPLLLEILPVDLGRFQPFVIAGFGLSLNTTSAYDLKKTFKSNISDYQEINTSSRPIHNVRNTVPGVIGSVGTRYRPNARLGLFGFEVRYVSDLKKAFDDTDPIPLTLEIRRNVIIRSPDGTAPEFQSSGFSFLFSYAWSFDL